MIVCCVNSCAYCGAPIEPEQRWVRVKIYDPALKDREPSYRRFHAEPFAGQHECCWEKHQLDLELSRTTTRAA